MALYEFTAVLDRPPADEDLDRLFEAGLDDTTPETRSGRGVLAVAREAPSLSLAIVSIVDDADRAGFRVIGLDDDDLVSLRSIAERLGRSYESVRLLANGKRGPGGFPAALSGDGWALYSWAEVADWFSVAYGTAPMVSESARVLAAADHLLRARELVDAPILAELAALSHP